MTEPISQDQTGQRRVPTTVTIGHHPLHPILIVFPIALLMAALGSDVLFWWTRDPFFARGSLWLVGGGALGAVVAAITGLIDFATVRYTREQISSWSHMLAGITTLALATANFLTRYPAPVDAVLPLGLLLSLDTAVMLIFTGWLGGNLTFRHLIGSYLEEEEAEALAAIKKASPKQETQ
jgi:uncharacterized membrane protein